MSTPTDNERSAVPKITEAQNCVCNDWTPQIRQVNAPILLASLRAGKPDLYKGKPFAFCPWCGGKLPHVDLLLNGERISATDWYPCRVCGKQIDTAEICNECVSTPTQTEGTQP